MTSRLLVPSPVQVVSQNLTSVKEVLAAPHEVTVASLPGLDSLAAWADVFRVNQGAEVWGTLGPWMEEVQPKCAPGIWDRLQTASTFTAGQVTSRESSQYDCRCDRM